MVLQSRLSLVCDWAHLPPGHSCPREGRCLLVRRLPVVSEITHLPQSLPCVVPALAWPPQSCSKRSQEETGRGQRWGHLFLEKGQISHQSSSCSWVMKEDRNRKPPCSCPHLTMTYGHRRENSYWMATADAKSGCSAVWIGETQWLSLEGGGVS